MSNGVIFYEGPSQIDGKPIVGIATGLLNGGANSKTGPMVQIYIIRSDMSPVEAVHTGDDVSICGDCKHRGRIEIHPTTGKRRNVKRSCYVTLFHGPRVVFDAYQRGIYKTVPLAVAARMLAGKQVRVGTYGDTGAIPITVWRVLLAKVLELNAYSHLWKLFPELAEFCMASCDTEEEREEAKALGFRTFRVRSEGDPKLAGEGHCPASNEMGKAVQCGQCMLCGGNRGKGKADITILAHGVGARNFANSLA